MLRLENARYAIHDRYPCLEVEIEGRPCRIIAEHKRPFYEAGLVFVGEEFSDVCPPVTLLIDGRPQTFRGFCPDPRLFQLWDDFLGVGAEFREGPVPIPSGIRIQEGRLRVTGYFASEGEAESRS